MAYTKQTWADRVVQHAKRFTYTDDGTHLTLTSAPGTVTAVGTPVNAANLNHIEDGIVDLELRELFDHKQMRNLVLNGDFSNGMTSWVGADASVVNGMGRLLANAQYSAIDQVIAVINTHKYYMGALAQGASGLLIGFFAGTLIDLPSTLGRSSQIITATATANWSLGVIDVRNSGFTEAFIDNVVLVDLTAYFGAGLEPTAAQMDAYLATYPNSWFGGIDNTGIVESGSNANGSYIKFADGTMICSSDGISHACNIATGSLYRSADVTWTFPATFYATPRAFASGDNLVIGAASAWSTTSCTVNGYVGDNGRVGNVRLLAIGRWKA